MSNCKLQTLYFASTKFEVLDEFEGERGTFIKSFLISNKLNLNDWEVTAEANRLDGPEFKGMPGIEFFNKGRRDHTVGSTYPEALRLQSPHSKGIIRKVLGAETGEKLEQISRIFDEKIAEKLRNKEIQFVSPAIFPRSIEDVEIIEKPGGGHIHRIHRYLPLHYAFVDEPAFGGDAKITDMCEGDDCLIKLAKVASDGIGQDAIDPLREIPIIRVSKCTKTGNTTVQISGETELSEKVSECLSQKLSPGEDPTDQDIAICFSEARNSTGKSINSKILKTNEQSQNMATDDITKDEKEKLNARIAQLEDNEKKRDEEAKKAKKAAEQNEDNHEEDLKENTAMELEDDDKSLDSKKSKKAKKAKKAAEEETDKEKEQSTKIASLTKIANTPIIESYLAARKMVGDNDDALEVIKTAMLKASVEENQSKLDEIKPFIAHLNFNNQVEQESAKTITHPYGLRQQSGSTKTSTEIFTELYE